MAEMKNNQKPHEALGFRTKTAALSYYRAMLRPGAALDQEMILKLLEHHPRASTKIGCGIEHFYVAGAAFGTRCFYAKRRDGSRVDFSIGKCFEGLKNTPKAAVIL